MDQGPQQSPTTNGAPGAGRQAVQSQALYRGAHAFLDLMKSDPAIKRYIMKHNKAAVQTDMRSGESQSVIERMQQEINLLKAELAHTQRELSETRQELESTKTVLAKHLTPEATTTTVSNKSSQTGGET